MKNTILEIILEALFERHKIKDLFTTLRGGCGQKTGLS